MLPLPTGFTSLLSLSLSLTHLTPPLLLPESHVSEYCGFLNKFSEELEAAMRPLDNIDIDFSLEKLDSLNEFSDCLKGTEFWGEISSLMESLQRMKDDWNSSRFKVKELDGDAKRIYGGFYCVRDKLEEYVKVSVASCEWKDM